MKKPVKIILWSTGILIALVIILAAVFLINFLSATKSMTPSETGAVNDSVWCIKDKYVNAYIFRGDSSYLLVDAGIEKERFRSEMERMGINPDQVTTLLLTHTDGDHTGAIALFRNAAIYMHKDEEQMINGTTGKTKFHKTIWKYGKYELFDSNDNFIIDGLKIKIFHTPGHTPGSVCFSVGDDYLLTGDNLVVNDGKYEHFTETFNMNTPEQTKSLTILPDPASFRYILTSHNGVIGK